MQRVLIYMGYYNMRNCGYTFKSAMALILKDVCFEILYLKRAIVFNIFQKSIKAKIIVT